MTEQTGNSSRTWLAGAVVLVISWALYLSFFGPRHPAGGDLRPPLLQAPPTPLPAEYRWVLRDLQDAPVDFAKYKGRVVLLNIWATWCPPCVAELPSIANLAGNPRLKDVSFLCVSTDKSADPVRAFLRGKSWPMTILHATEIPEVFLTDGIPATFLIAPDGRIAAAEVGSAQWDDPSVVEFLERMTKEKTGNVPSAEEIKH